MNFFSSKVIVVRVDDDDVYDLDSSFFVND